MKKVTVTHNGYALVQKVEEAYSPNDSPVDKTPSVMASTGLAKLLLEVADNRNYIKRAGVIDKHKINFNEYETDYAATTGEFIDFGDIRKSFDATYANNLFMCACGNTKKFEIINKISELKAVGMKCTKCHKEYWFIPKYISEELERFERNVYNNTRLDVETKMVAEQDFIDRVQRFPVGGQYIIFEKRDKK